MTAAVVICWVTGFAIPAGHASLAGVDPALYSSMVGSGMCPFLGMPSVSWHLTMQGDPRFAGAVP